MSDEEKALRIGMLTVESLVLARGKGALSFDELASQYGRDVGVTAKMARDAIMAPLVAVVAELQVSTTLEIK